ncbi:MAG: glucosaminidase domain-containing protein [Bacteroidales bacterium]|jgi:LysM repeat protein|nr:glucosaminidase domain-containing protein [Bacteroidales bacterium]MCU0409107.1 glucosaminidase domain-containing protein [Bacteroidales bacterium]
MVRSGNSIILLLLLLLVSAGCGSRKPAVQPVSSSSSQLARDYVNRYAEIAVSEMKRTGVPASIKLAQGMIESDYGRSTLARNANNHFGIKCHNGWTGATVTHHDDRRNECFRKYKRVEDSFRDHSDFLVSGSRYRDLFKIDPTDYREWAKGLKKAGYATNPEYANILIRSIEENNLWQYDRGTKPVISSPAVMPADTEKVIPQTKPSGTVQNAGSGAGVYAVAPRILENNRIQYIIVKDGESREKLEKEFGLLRWELPRYNELDNDFVPGAGQLLYLQPKREKAAPGNDYHVVAEGEKMYGIAQKYGIKLKSLHEMNGIAEGTEALTGAKLRLR